MAELIVYRSNALMSVRSRIDATRDVVMPVNLAYAESMVGLWHSGLPQVSLVPSTATDAQVWPVLSAVGTRIHDTSDDNCPINTGWSYVGGNHGYNVGNQIAVTNHGKTTADVGSQWSDGTRVFTLLAVTNASSLLFGNPYTIVDGIAQGARVKPAAPLTHVSGATNRTTVPITGLTPDVQIRPVTHSHTVAVELDGRPVPDGRSTGLELVIRESYVIPSYQGMIDTARANIGTPIATIMPRIPSLCRISNVYRWSPGGGLLVTQQVTALTRFTLNAGVTQCAPLTPVPGGTRRQFMPNVGAAGGLNWSAWANIDTLAALTDFTPATLTNRLMPASSMTQWVVAGGGTQQWGIAVGLLPVADGTPEIRVRNTTAKGWFISASLKKNYPQLVWGRTLAAGESVTGTAYRRYLTPPSTATEIVVSDGGRDFVLIERVGTVAQAQMAAPQLYQRLLVPVGPTNLTVPDRVTVAGVPYTVPVSPGYGMWRADPDAAPPQPLPGVTRTRGGYFLARCGPTAESSCAGTYQRLLLHPFFLAEPTPVDRACLEVTRAGTGVLRHGVYAHDPATGRPAVLGPVADFGSVAVTSVGVRESVLDTAVTLPAGWHWYGHVWQVSGVTPPSVRTGGVDVGTVLSLGATAAAMTGDRFGYEVTGTTGALGAITVTGVHQFPPPQVAYRRA
ncbi:hypothetical protein [Micromonospora rifamycinica]|uniref:Uncharacterized protein n=1 Tax=Micromonospora rifamycinica TaxID=291594 RepID=A0A109INB5_9ACTN|nr:hypothetical protein [Micromonospora rifamycinica]KWV33693.1 hypothetical protein AWV63_05785 [Micromonospora rifamycinica]SCG49950.1 hypothetical protein GA0070623_1761 [Micromonospora rifamycinica]